MGTILCSRAQVPIRTRLTYQIVSLINLFKTHLVSLAAIEKTQLLILDYKIVQCFVDLRAVTDHHVSAVWE